MIMNKHNVFSLDELKQWKIDPLINPRTKKTIKINGPTFKIIKKEYHLVDLLSFVQVLNQYILHLLLAMVYLISHIMP